MCEFVENVRGVLDTAFVISVSKIHYVVVNHQHLFNYPRVNDTISHSSQKVQPPCSENVVRGGEVLLRELPEA